MVLGNSLSLYFVFLFYVVHRLHSINKSLYWYITSNTSTPSTSLYFTSLSVQCQNEAKLRHAVIQCCLLVGWVSECLLLSLHVIILVGIETKCVRNWIWRPSSPEPITSFSPCFLWWNLFYVQEDNVMLHILWIRMLTVVYGRFGLLCRNSVLFLGRVGVSWTGSSLTVGISKT